MKSVKLKPLQPGQVMVAEIHGGAFALGSSEDGTTLLCGTCEKPIIEGYKADGFFMDQVDLVCQHCGAHNIMDASRL